MPATSNVLIALEPLLQLGPDHIVCQGLLAALEADARDMTRNTVGRGASNEDRQWWAGAISHALELRDEIEQALEARREP
jgi:hypothetical protein